jgi:hypothetical protein
MKSFFYLATIVFILQNCNEKLDPYIFGIKSISDSSYISKVDIDQQVKNILIEEFTGVRCPNCPSGTLELDRIQEKYRERIIPVGMHFGFLSDRIKISVQDLEYREAEGPFGDLFGKIPQKPLAAINRIVKDNSLYIQPTEWESSVIEELKKSSPVVIKISNIFELDSFKLSTSIKFHFTESINEYPVKYSVYLIESNIVTAQIRNQETDTFYNHQNVLRKMLTAYDGNVFYDSTRKNRVYIKNFEFKLKPEYKAENMKVVVTVHKSGASKEVLQVVEKSIK